jgi:hypothetical protein
MRVLGYVPSLNRNTSGEIANIIAPFCDKFVAVLQGSATCEERVPNVEKVHREPGMRSNRNFALQMALDEGYDVVISSDDDIKFSPKIVAKLLEQIEVLPSVGMVSSTSRTYYYFNRELKSNMPFIVSPFPTQLFAVRTRAIEECGLYDLEVLEDLEWGLRFWQNGYACVNLHVSMDYTHNPFIPRMAKGDSGGGQTVSAREAHFEESLDYIRNKYVGTVLNSVANKQYKGRKSYQCRYNWDWMTTRVTDMWGAIGYEDSRGREL